MKTRLKLPCRLLLTLAAALCLTRGVAATYYVDSAAGNDANNGTSTSTPWQTLTKVNATTFAPGDSILFKAGGSWSGSLNPKGSGNAANPIVIDVYNTGAKPIINGNGVSGTGTTGGGAVYLFNQEYWEINNLEVINDGASDAERRGIHIAASNFGTVDHIHIKNCYIHNIRGLVSSADGDLTAKRTGGIIVEVISDSTTATRFNDVLLENNTITTVRNEGIVAQNNRVSANDFPGTSAWTARKVTNLIIRGNTISDVSKNAMIIRLADSSSLVENNVCFNTATLDTGNTMFTAACDGVVFQFNEGYENNAGPLGDHDGSLYDADLRSINIKFQYSYSHDNTHGLFWQYPSASGANANIICRYNISRADRGIIFAFSGDAGASSTSHIYNNTIYTPANLSPIFFDGRTSAANTHYVSNNIFYNLSTTASFSFDGSDVGSFGYNVWYGNRPSGTPLASTDLTSDPLLVSPGSGGTGIGSVTGYQLQAGSPAIDSGVTIANHGGRDYFGNTVPQNGTTDRGAHEFAGSGNTPPSITTQPQSQTVSAGANVTFTVVAAGSSPLSYQWRKGGVDISGATSSSYSLTSVTTNDAGNYDVVVTNPYGSVTSLTATLTVTTGGGGAGAIVIAEVYTGGGKTGATYQNDFVVLKNSGGSSASVNGWSLQHDKAGVWQTPFALPNVSIPAGGHLLIKCYNDGTANGAALPTADGTTPQSSAWNFSTTVGGAVALVNNTTTLSGCSGASIVDLVGFNATASNCYEGAGVAPTGSASQSDQRANSGCQDTGDNAADFALGTPNPRNSASPAASCGGGCTPPSITGQPANQTVCVGATAAFSVTATGTGLTYQWQLSVGGGAFNNISGAISAGYTTPATVTGDNGNQYRCVVSGTCGSATSSAATLTINARPTSVASGSAMICSGASTTLQAALTGTAPWNVTWSDGFVQNGVAASPASRSVNPTTTTTYTITGLTDANCTTQAGDRTGSAVVTVNTAPAITTQPQSQTVTAGANVTFSVTATGTAPLTYQWRKGGANISGATASSYTLTGVTTNDSGSYDVVVVNSCGSVTSAAAALTVNPAGGLPAPWQTMDIGTVGIVGSATESGGTFTVKGSGTGLTGTSDQFRYLYQTMSGDGSITVRLSSQSGTTTASLAGVMVRETTATGSRFAAMVRRGSGNNNMRALRRSSTGGTISSTSGASLTPPNCWLRVTRTGNSLQMLRSSDGISWNSLNTSTITMATDVTVGIIVTSGSNTVLDTDVFTNVTVVP